MTNLVRSVLQQLGIQQIHIVRQILLEQQYQTASSDQYLHFFYHCNMIATCVTI